MVRFDDIAGCIKSCAEQRLLHNVYRIMLEMCFNMCTDVNSVVVRLNRVRTDLDLTTPRGEEKHETQPHQILVV